MIHGKFKFYTVFNRDELYTIILQQGCIQWFLRESDLGKYFKI